MTTEQEKVLSRVRKMLKLATNEGATEGERDNAMRMARSTLAKYNLDMAQVETDDQRLAEKRILHDVQFYGRPWARNVSKSAAMICFCEYLFLTAKRPRDTRHVFVGKTSNAITAAELAVYLVQSVSREARSHQGHYALGNDAFRSFAWGASIAIASRARSILQGRDEKIQTPSPNDGKALMILQENESQENVNFIQSVVPRVRQETKIAGRPTNDFDAYRAGHRYGESVSLDRQLASQAEARRLRRK